MRRNYSTVGFKRLPFDYVGEDEEICGELVVKRVSFMSLILSVGLIAGYSLRASMEPPREDRMMALLATICAPFVERSTIDFAPLEPLNLPGFEAFGDKKSKTLIRLKDENGLRTCSLSDELSPLDRPAKERLLVQVDTWAKSNLMDHERQDLSGELNWIVFLAYGGTQGILPDETRLTVFEPGILDDPSIKIALTKLLKEEAT